MGQYEHSIWPGYHKVASLEVLNGSWSTKLIKYHGLKAFSRKQLNKLIILVVLLCPLYSIVYNYAIFEKHKIIKMAFVSICQHMHEQFIFFAKAQAESVALKLESQAVTSTL